MKDSLALDPLDRNAFGPECVLVLQHSPCTCRIGQGQYDMADHGHDMTWLGSNPGAARAQGLSKKTDMWGRSPLRDQRDGGRVLVTVSMQPCAASRVTLPLSSHA